MAASRKESVGEGDEMKCVAFWKSAVLMPFAVFLPPVTAEVLGQ